MQVEKGATTQNRTVSATPREWWVSRQSPRASDGNPGSPKQPLRSISAAAERAHPGDTIRIGAGIYRERVSPARGGCHDRPITYQAEPGADVRLRGSEEIPPEAWLACPDAPGVWRLRLDWMPAPAEFNPFRLGNRGYCDPARPHRPEDGSEPPLVRGQVFLDGEPMLQTTSLDTVLHAPGHWTVDPEGEFLLFHPPAPANGQAPFPEGRLVEVSVRHRIFAPHKRHLGHIHLRNLVFEHCANNHPTPQIGAVSVRAGHHWVIEGCTIRHANTIGLDLGTEWGIEETPEDDGLDLTHPRGRDFEAHPAGDHLVRGNVISDNGLCGIVGMHQYRTRLVENVIEHNNALGFRTFEIGAVKFHFFFDGVIERNLIRDNDAYGVWLDNRYAGSRVARNLILNNYVAGVFIEMGLGPVMIDHNIIAYTRNGDGVYAHDASGLTIAHNLLYANAHTGVNLTLATDRNARDGKPVRCSDNQVLNNVICGSQRAALSFPVPWERARNNQSDGNAFMGGGNPMDEGTGPEPPLFHLNRCHSRLSLSASLDICGSMSAALLEGSGSDLKTWNEVCGQDSRSRIFESRRDILATRGLHLDIIWDPELMAVETVEVPGLEEAPDYLGDILAPESPLPPGPFRRYACGVKSRRSLWPHSSGTRRVEARQDDASADLNQVWASLAGLSSTGL